jgi:ketosteroid isomerase-like protein
MPASLELVKIALQAYGNGDSEIALALAAPLIRWDERASRTDGDLVWGHDKVGRAMRRYLDSWEEYRFDVEDLAEVGPGKVVGICRERGKPKEGTAVDRRFGGLWLVEHGKIASWATYLTPREAVRAAKELLGADVEGPLAKSTPVPEPEAESKPEPGSKPEQEPAPEPVEHPQPQAAPAPPETDAPPPFDFEAPQPPGVPESVEAPKPAEAPEPTEGPEATEAPVAERPRKRALTKSEEQKRAARARAELRKRASRQSA